MQGFAIIVVDDVEGAKGTPIGQTVTHKIYRPDLISRVRLGQGMRVSCGQPFLGFDTAVQAQFTVHPINPFVVPAEPLLAQPVHHLVETPAAVALGEGRELLPDRRCRRVAALDSDTHSGSGPPGDTLVVH